MASVRSYKGLRIRVAGTEVMTGSPGLGLGIGVKAVELQFQLGGMAAQLVLDRW